MATASWQEGRAVTERLRHLVTGFSAKFPITFTLADDAPMRGDTRARIGHTLWS